MQIPPTHQQTQSSQQSPGFFQRLLGAEQAVGDDRVQALPADWDQRDLDQRVREIGEW